MEVMELLENVNHCESATDDEHIHALIVHSDMIFIKLEALFCSSKPRLGMSLSCRCIFKTPNNNITYTSCNSSTLVVDVVVNRIMSHYRSLS